MRLTVWSLWSSISVGTRRVPTLQGSIVVAHSVTAAEAIGGRRNKRSACTGSPLWTWVL